MLCGTRFLETADSSTFLLSKHSLPLRSAVGSDSRVLLRIRLRDRKSKGWVVSKSEEDQEPPLSSLRGFRVEPVLRGSENAPERENLSRDFPVAFVVSLSFPHIRLACKTKLYIFDLTKELL